MKQVLPTQQFGFDFDLATATTPATSNPSPLILSAMQLLADRAHIKLDVMLQNEALAERVSLRVKADDKALFASALESDMSMLTPQQAQLFTALSQEVVDADARVYFSYEDVDALFSALSH